MILVLGNNEWSRHDILMSLFRKKYYVAEQLIDDAEFLTKPILTVYINPTTAQIKRIKKEKTICVVAKNNFIGAPDWMYVIPYDNTTSKRIVEIYDANCNYGKGREVFGILGLEKNKFTMGGAYIHMTPKQLKAIKILLYNSEKKFSSYDISSYFDFIGDRENSFLEMVREINYQCRRTKKLSSRL